MTFGMTIGDVKLQNKSHDVCSVNLVAVDWISDKNRCAGQISAPCHGIIYIRYAFSCHIVEEVVVGDMSSMPGDVRRLVLTHLNFAEINSISSVNRAINRDVELVHNRLYDRQVQEVYDKIVEVSKYFDFDSTAKSDAVEMDRRLANFHAVLWVYANSLVRRICHLAATKQREGVVDPRIQFTDYFEQIIRVKELFKQTFDVQEEGGNLLDGCLPEIFYAVAKGQYYNLKEKLPR